MGVDLDHLGSDHSPLYDIFNATMRPAIRGHIVRWVATHLPFKDWLPLERCSAFVRKCATARNFIGDHVRARRAALKNGDVKRKTTLDSSRDDEADVMQAMVEHEGLWNDAEVTEYVSGPGLFLSHRHSSAGR